MTCSIAVEQARARAAPSSVSALSDRAMRWARGGSTGLSTESWRAGGGVQSMILLPRISLPFARIVNPTVSLTTTPDLTSSVAVAVSSTKSAQCAKDNGAPWSACACLLLPGTSERREQPCSPVLPSGPILQPSHAVFAQKTSSHLPQQPARLLGSRVTPLCTAAAASPLLQASLSAGAVQDFPLACNVVDTTCVLSSTHCTLLNVKSTKTTS